MLSKILRNKNLLIHYGKKALSNSHLGPYENEMYKAYLENPENVHYSWKNFFTKRKQMDIYTSFESDCLNDYSSIYLMIENYWRNGHLFASTNPLQSLNENIKNEKIIQSVFSNYESKLNYSYDISKVLVNINSGQNILMLKEIISKFDKIYCGKIGIEMSHINDEMKIFWLRKYLECEENWLLNQNEKEEILESLIKATVFEEYLSKKWSSEKRFGLEGCEILIPALKKIIENCTNFNLENFIIGMSHRGRLNVLANIIEMPLSEIWKLFQQTRQQFDRNETGDVKYHYGLTNKIHNRTLDKTIHMTILSNPSHLEAVYPVLLGKIFEHQCLNNDKEGNKTIGILLHGDSAFTGQGVVYECMQMSNLRNYSVNGIIHIIVNNNIGFTTNPENAKSSTYCTDVVKINDIPVLHVNADDPESVIFVCKLAVDWRKEFKSDIVIDLVCYRRFGHNENDDPTFTQPILYKKIQAHAPILKLYSKKLIDENVISDKTYNILKKEYLIKCNEAFEKVNNTETLIDNKSSIDSSNNSIDYCHETPVTGIEEDLLIDIASTVSDVIPNFNIHDKIERILKERNYLLKNQLINWALGEAITIGSLLKSGINVRFTGQDIERGTFSHRHLIYHDQICSNKSINPLCKFAYNNTHLHLHNSLLSEYAAVGFELGFSINNQNSLVLWEAQFGDFVNNAQCILDQFLSSGESKWKMKSGLALLLPHGYEGMGPEHSSTRLERFLQLCSDDADYQLNFDKEFEMKQLYDINWFVVNCTTPANLFHVLRRQVLLPFRKPLIVVTPKSLLRLPEVRSKINEMTGNTKFQRILPESNILEENQNSVKELIMCSGKIYYDLIKERKNLQLEQKVAILRVEQISPFPYDLIYQEINKYPNSSLKWVQEEPKNMGAWFYVEPRIKNLLERKFENKRNQTFNFIGRTPSSSTATGFKSKHIKEQETILKNAFC